MIIKNLNNKYKNIIIDRQGIKPNSNMTTLDVISEVEPNCYYKLLKDSLIKVEQDIFIDNDQSDNNKKHSNIDYSKVKYCVIPNKWNNSNQQQCDTSESNILGNSGILQIDSSSLKIPQTSIEHLGFYNCILHKHNNVIKFNIDCPLPVCKMQIGDHYVENYIMKKAGGVYLEYHNRPHFHVPLINCRQQSQSLQNNGHLILGKMTEEGIMLSAFEIPYGYAVETPNNIIHNDCFLKGEYLVIYSKTPEYSTVLLKNNQGKPIKVDIV